MRVFIFISRIFTIPIILLKYSVKRTYVDQFGTRQKLDNPIRLRLIFEDLGGVFIKFGQILAMRFDLIPMSYARALLNLLDNDRIVPNDRMFNVFLDETGKDIRDVFDNFNEKSIATASFAQVYKGTYKKEPIVIKIQKPNTEKYISSDLAILGLFSYVIDKIGILRAVSMKEVVFQMREWLKDELDYTIEACNAQTIYDHTNKHNLKDVVIPKIYHELSTKRVLVQEFLDGFQANKIINNLITDPEKTKRILKENNIDLLEVSNFFLRDIMRQYFIDGFFHADPHPANLIIFPGNKIGYIDFGIIGKLKYNNFGMLKYIKGSVDLEFNFAAKGIVDFIEIRTKGELGGTLDKKNVKKLHDIVLEFIVNKLTEDFKPITNDWHFYTGNKELDLKKRSSAVTFLKVVKSVEKYYMKFPPDVIAFIRALLIIDMVCLKLTDDFNMIKAINSFFERHTLDEVKTMSASHMVEVERIHEIRYTEANLERTQDREYEAREKFIDIVYALAEKYPELYNKIKRIKI